MTDEGTYACELIVTRDDGTTETATGTVDVDVYVPATVGKFFMEVTASIFY